MFILSSTIEREIGVPMFFRTKEEAQNEMKKQFAETVGIKVDELDNWLYSDEADCDENEFAINEDNAFCTNMNHDNCDWAIHEVIPCKNHKGKKIMKVVYRNDYTAEYCPYCDNEVFIHAYGTTRCPECKTVIFPCSVCIDESGGCRHNCPYGDPMKTENRVATNPDMTKEEIKWCEKNL